MRTPLPPVAAVIGFIDAINRGDVDRLVALMSPGHRLQVLQEPAATGREAIRDAWNGYAPDRTSLFLLVEVPADDPEPESGGRLEPAASPATVVGGPPALSLP